MKGENAAPRPGQEGVVVVERECNRVKLTRPVRDVSPIPVLIKYD